MKCFGINSVKLNVIFYNIKICFIIRKTLPVKFIVAKLGAMAFGERLQEVRRRAGLTQEQFAAELNVSRQAVSKWESCRGYPEIEKILYICNRYQVSLDELFSQEVPRQLPCAG